MGTSSGKLALSKTFMPTCRTNWIPTSDAPDKATGLAQSYPSCAAIAGKVYVAGGRGGEKHAAPRLLKSIDSYDPVTDTWATVSSELRVARAGAQLVTCGGKLYAIGGVERKGTSPSPSSCVDMFDPSTETWTKVASLSTPRARAAACALDGKIYVTGGIATLLSDALTAGEFYNPDKDEWQPLPPMNAGRCDHAMVAINRSLYVVGGASAAPTAKAVGVVATSEVLLLSVAHSHNLHVGSNVWADCGRLATPRRRTAGITVVGPASVSSDGGSVPILVLGGESEDGNLLATIDAAWVPLSSSSRKKMKPFMRPTLPPSSKQFKTLPQSASQPLLGDGAGASGVGAGTGGAGESKTDEEAPPAPTKLVWKTTSKTLLVPRAAHGVACVGSVVFVIGGIERPTITGESSRRSASAKSLDDRSSSSVECGVISQKGDAIHVRMSPSIRLHKRRRYPSVHVLPSLLPADGSGSGSTLPQLLVVGAEWAKWSDDDEPEYQAAATTVECMATPHTVESLGGKNGPGACAAMCRS